MMVPYLVLTMLDIILAGAGGIVIVVALFYANIIPGNIPFHLLPPPSLFITIRLNPCLSPSPVQPNFIFISFIEKLAKITKLQNFLF